ncbi:hypothetical protein BDU57DRAFT_567380 [Ampelomyces quisqualis]|uniref:SET domain-containing protein n=1 Tax=Ampelomyces quisqualis TaxID=50730 RepID=A0A6A5QVH1_AMPQU|nr:hypothetical protein BDU57DRAFT_567380 [Ampelomyces quisqualis]
MRLKRGELSKRRNAPLDEAIDKLERVPTQENIVDFILESGFRTASGDFQHKFSAKHIQRLLRMLYSSDKPNTLNFYSQERDGLPTAKVESKVAGRTIQPTVALLNNLDVPPWRWTRRPEGFPKEAEWPPTAVSHLLGCAPMEDWCLECHSTIRADVLSDEYLNWRDKMFTFWLENLRLYTSRKYGYGVKARNEIPKNTILGEYTGDLVPERPRVSHEITQYHFDIYIGKNPDGHKDQADCWLDATKKGSILRFVNHSCDPNAEAKLGRCTIHNRVVFMVTNRDVEENEQITIDYGAKWFATEDEPCLCESSNCKNPPRKGGHKEEPKNDGKVARGGKLSKNPKESSKIAEKEVIKLNEQDEEAANSTPSTQVKDIIRKKFEKQARDSKKEKIARGTDVPSKSRGVRSKQPSKQDERTVATKEGKRPVSSKTTKEKAAKGPRKWAAASKKKEKGKGSGPSAQTREAESQTLEQQDEATQASKEIGNLEILRKMKENRAEETEPKPSPRPRRTSPRLALASASEAAEEAVQVRKRSHAEDANAGVRPAREKTVQKEEDLKKPKSSPRPRKTSLVLKAASGTTREPGRKRQHADDKDEELQPPRKKLAQKDLNNMSD